MSAPIEVEGLCHSFGGQEVLRDIAFTVAPGQILAVMGGSGGGKTTLLRCISGLIPPSKGVIRVGGVDVVREPDRARERIALVFQHAALFDYLNVGDNVLFGVRRRKRHSPAELRSLLARSLEAVGLAGSEKLMPSELSGGMRKRIGLARALAMSPAVLLYDEPTSGLDPVTAYSIDQLIVRTRDLSGVTSIVVSHDVTSVFRVADQIAFLDKGRLTFYGTAEEFRAAAQDAISEVLTKARSESI
jgi:phospholipid/cholesterol/gamma-HCH transport system ATP-binding protein